MLRTIKVYGELAEFLGRRMFKAAVSSPAEAVRFLLANFPRLEAHLAQGHYRISVGREVLPLGSDPDALHLPSGQAEIRIVPVLAGAGAAGRIIAGVALVAAAVFLGPAGAFIGGLGASVIGGTAATIAAGIGFSLALGGVAQLLTPTPQLGGGNDSDNDPRKSYSFSGIQNVSRQGVPVPVIYGEVLTGSVVISAGIRVEKV